MPSAGFAFLHSTTAIRPAEFIFNQGEAAADRSHDIRAWFQAMAYKPTYDEAEQ